MNFMQNAIKKVVSYGLRAQPKMATTLNLSEINEFFGGNSDSLLYGTDISEITYFTCLKILSESLGKLSLHLQDDKNNNLSKHDTYYSIKVRPNPWMTPYTFRVLMEYWRNHYGNAYALIKYDRKGKLQGMYPMDPRAMEIIVDNQAEFFDRPYYYRYSDTRSGKSYLLRPEDVLHLKGGLSKDGLCGMCVRETLARNMQGNKAAQDFLNKLYQGNLTANAVIKYVGDFDSKKKKALTEELKNFTASGTDRFIPLPLGMDITPLDLKLTDSQFYELKKFSSLQVAAAFGIKPNQLNNYDKSSYANSETQNLVFYTDTLLPILTSWEDELNYKLLTSAEVSSGVSYKFNVATILRGDIKTQMEALRGYVGSGIYQLNEARGKAGLPPVPGGDVNLINGTYVPIKDVGKDYAEKGGNGNA